MPHELTVPSATPASANGHAPPAESPLDRARRVLRGDVRPADYLSVPDDVIAFVDGTEARSGVRLLPEYHQLHIDNLTLQEHHAGNIVLCRHTGDGVVILAAGFNPVYDLADALSPDERRLIIVEHPPAFPDAWGK